MSSHLKITQLITFLYRYINHVGVSAHRTAVFVSKWGSLQEGQAILLTDMLECVYYGTI
jgi:hypothetical protein